MAEILITVLRPREKPQLLSLSTALPDSSMSILRTYKVAKVALVAGLGNTYAFTWQNPESNKIIIHEVIVDITTASTAAATMDVDVVANATSHGDTIFDALPLNAAALHSSHDVGVTGTNGNEKPHKVDENGGANDWVTGYEAANQSMAGLVGYVYIFYTEV